ncbi:fumarylacetoacetate hydrolase family protein [Pseudonocardia sp. KRD291]|uniref:fumarylacetoacetate hydrolase family protein n=1 Tax=Pseudonocardia sp. KRD291 TaxID=2792007 RepID=UPI001C4A3C09|nr:fumarylacetoacetate hydrolase family protein [Pseudonocardia sp. KRD291]MBW0101029.1 fumarylacetoacetate hydrolase family protein [Pseudonocardia sp. KRD291]
MRLATFLPPGTTDAPFAGDVRDDEIVAFDRGVAVEDLIASGERPTPTGARYPLAEVTLLAPYVPRAVFGVALNYAKHIDETASARPTDPMVFLKGPASVTAPSGPVVRPPTVERLDYEGELAWLIGPDGGVGGYAIANDVSARDIPDRMMTVHKGGDTFCPWGPWVTTADHVPDAYDLRVRTWVDGELRQDASTADMIFRADQLLAHIGRTIMLRPGDMILSGTPDGVALGSDPPRFLEPGQVVRIEIEGLGSIEHEIVAAAPALEER